MLRNNSKLNYKLLHQHLESVEFSSFICVSPPQFSTLAFLLLYFFLSVTLPNICIVFLFSFFFLIFLPTFFFLTVSCYSFPLILYFIPPPFPLVFLHLKN